MVGNGQPVSKGGSVSSSALGRVPAGLLLVAGAVPEAEEGRLEGMAILHKQRCPSKRIEEFKVFSQSQISDPQPGLGEGFQALRLRSGRRDFRFGLTAE